MVTPVKGKGQKRTTTAKLRLTLPLARRWTHVGANSAWVCFADPCHPADPAGGALSHGSAGYEPDTGSVAMAPTASMSAPGVGWLPPP